MRAAGVCALTQTDVRSDSAAHHPVLGATGVDRSLGGSLVVSRLKRQLRHILPKDAALSSDGDGALTERLRTAMVTLGEDGLCRIAESFAASFAGFVHSANPGAYVRMQSEHKRHFTDEPGT